MDPASVLSRHVLAVPETLKMFTIGHVPSNKGKKMRIPRRGRFQKGHTLWKNAYSTADDIACTSTETMSNRVDDTVHTPVSHSSTEMQTDVEASPARRLRSMVAARSPSLKIEEDPCLNMTGMRFLDSEKMMGMLNSVNRQHREQSPTCKDADFQSCKQKKMGICWTYTLKCLRCQFTSPPFKLYDEIPTEKPGPNPGAPNMALASVLQDCPIGNTKTQEILARLNCPPPSRTSMNRMSNAVGKEAVDLNKRDMAQKVEVVKAVNRSRGNPENEVNITVDGRYNTQTITSRKKPGLNASQALSVAVETVTGMSYIIAAVCENTLCWRGAWLRSQNFEVNCPGGHEDCTANKYRAAPVSEYTMGKEIGNQLALQNLLVRHATTDGDGRSAQGIEDAIKALHPLWSVTRLADHVHLGQTQFRTAMKAQFSEQMFFGRTKDERLQQKKMFCLDVKSRCSMIVKSLMQRHNRNIQSVCKDLPAVLEATVRCYTGDCQNCKEHSVVCGGTETSNWWVRSTNLSTYNIRVLRMERKDVLLLIEILKMKLSEDAINSMKLYDSTNKNEAVHRAISVNLPKNVNFSRNMEARLSSGVHRNNNKPGTSAILKCDHHGIKLSDSSKSHLARMDKKFTYQREYEKRPEVIKRRLQQSAQRLNEHKAYKDLHGKNPDYKKRPTRCHPCS